MRVSLKNGKYEMVFDGETMKALRYGAPWRDFTGNKFMYLLLARIDELRYGLEASQKLFDQALPKFNWGASALDANAITLLNDVPIAVRRLLDLK